MRGTMLSDLRGALKASSICSGWFSILFTKQRSINPTMVTPNNNLCSQANQDVHFIAVYRVSLEKQLTSMIKLKGLYPSVNLSGSGASAELTDHWFSNHLDQPQM